MWIETIGEGGRMVSGGALLLMGVASALIALLGAGLDGGTTSSIEESTPYDYKRETMIFGNRYVFLVADLLKAIGILGFIAALILFSSR